ncbi:hypothetical protein AJ80_05935 [Polytolypa hystricis UAMH7299]|uniref:Uncharacterized protein n=1 Tax=Polytolypa hystricis (strain UAMH7299) TaxID=1447883 RepID=A0A2B7XZH9_POLH7|nr:hypothetical protein AJ80_05935 [Polytolypa hystricis UAMH7299]
MDLAAPLHNFKNLPLHSTTPSGAPNGPWLFIVDPHYHNHHRNRGKGVLHIINTGISFDFRLSYLIEAQKINLFMRKAQAEVIARAMLALFVDKFLIDDEEGEAFAPWNIAVRDRRLARELEERLLEIGLRGRTRIVMTNDEFAKFKVKTNWKEMKDPDMRKQREARARSLYFGTKLVIRTLKREEEG